MKERKEVVGSMSEWTGVLSDFFRQIKDGGLTREHIQALLERRNPLESVDYSALVADWKRFYRGIDIKTDFPNLRIPEKQKGFDRLIILAKGMTPQKLFDKCKELFPSRKYIDENLDKVVISDRSAKNSAYAVWVRERIEADEELKNLSANDLKNQGEPQITLEERLAYELKFFKEEGKHLDVDNITLCACSHYSDGNVPNANWYNGKLKVNWYNPGNCNDNLRSRREVSRRNPS